MFFYYLYLKGWRWQTLQLPGIITVYAREQLCHSLGVTQIKSIEFRHNPAFLNVGCHGSCSVSTDPHVKPETHFQVMYIYPTKH